MTEMINETPMGETRGRRESTDSLMASTEHMQIEEPGRKKRTSETDLSEIRSASAFSRARSEETIDLTAKVEGTSASKEETTSSIKDVATVASKFRVAAKVATVATTAARVHRTRRLSAGDAATHSIAEDECIAFIDFINTRLSDDKDLTHVLPIESVDDMWTAVGDGILLCKLINVAAPDTIDLRAVNLPKNGVVSAFHTVENQNLALMAAKGIGIKVVNVGSQDMVEGKPHLILGLVWQIVKMSLLAKISLKENPFLVRLLQPGETLEELLKLTPEQLLTRWVDYHLAASGCARRLQNFGADLRDSEIYSHLLSQIDPEGKASTAILADTDLLRRAEYVTAQGVRLGAEFQVRPVDIIKANDKLNLGFLATLFNQFPGLDPPDATELKLFDELEDDDAGDSREERAFRNWINSLGLEGAHCGNLFEDVRDGVLLLKTMDHVKKGLVEWKRVNLPPLKMIFKKVENANYAIELATSAALRFSLVGVQGKDIVDGNKKLTLALIWQLMRTHMTDLLASLRSGNRSGSGGGGTMSDAEMVKWATSRVNVSGRPGSMRDFADKSLASGLFLLDLLAAIEPRCVNRELVTPGTTDEERMLNARYAIACARKLNCAIFCLPEDIVEVKPKMILAFIASVMAFDLQQKPAAA